MNAYMERVLEDVKKRNANEPEFLQAVEEVFNHRRCYEPAP